MDLKYNFKPRLIRRITYISHVNKKRGYSHCDHVHYRYGHEIIYLDYGRMDITLDGKMFRLNAGEIIFIKGGVHHSFKGRDELPFDYLNAMFRERCRNVCSTSRCRSIGRCGIFCCS